MSVAQDLGLTAKEIVKWAEFGLMVVLVASVVERPRDAVIAVAAILAAGCIEALYGLGQAANGAGPAGFLIGGNLLRAFGHFGQPNPFAAYVATGLLVAGGIGIALVTRSPRSLLSPTGVLVALVGGVLLLALLASLSRSAWIAVAAAVVVMLVAHDRRTAPLVGLGFLLALLLGLVGLFGLLPPVVTSRFTVLLDNFALFDARSVTLSAANFALVQRMAIWQAAWEIYQQHPVLGIGLGNFDVAYPSYALPGWPQLPGHAHNHYLNLLAELGVLGLSAYVVLLGWLYVSVWRAVQQAKAALGQPEMPALAVYGAALGALGVLVLLTVHHLFDNLYVPWDHRADRNACGSCPRRATATRTAQPTISITITVTMTDTERTHQPPQEAPQPLISRALTARSVLSFVFALAILTFFATRLEINIDGIRSTIAETDFWLYALAFLVYYCTFPLPGLPVANHPGERWVQPQARHPHAIPAWA